MRRARIALALAGALAAIFPVPARAELAGAYLAARSADIATDFAPARDYLVRALGQDATNPELLDALITAYVGLGEFDSAVPVARRLASLGAQSQIAAMTLLTATLVQEDYAQVLADLADPEVRILGPVIDPLVRGWAHLGAGSMAQALEEFDKLSKTQGLEVFGLYHKALALGMVGDFEGADALFRDAQNPLMGMRRAVFAHAQVLSQLDRDDAALARLDDLFGASATDPELDALRAGLRAEAPVPFDTVRSPRDGMAEVFYVLAVVFQGDAPDLQTLVHARMAEFLRADHADAILLSAAVLDALGQEELAIAAYDRIGTDRPAHLAAATGKTQALYKLDRKADAIAAAEDLVRSHGQYLSVHVALGDLLRREERYADAADAYSRAISLVDAPDERHWGLYYSRGIAWEQAKQWDKAEPDFRKALELRPEQPQVLNYLGYSLLDRNDKIPEALGMIERAVAQRPDDGYIIDSLAWGYFLTGRYDEAVIQMERASLLMPVDPIVTDHLGDVYWAVGRLSEARFQWHRALSFGPTEQDAARIRRKLEIGLDDVLAEEGLPALSERGRK
ncbi:hypothetical protein GCM10011345_13950 [Gemmobacter megaterium]|nr:tetratricopeptide repeat protein [Gemmobacter megaterium]GGE09337.1 hypothetical protein GCM10011345_13950 [Gemmobacter megaterium]